MSKATIYSGALEGFLPSNNSKRKGTLVLVLDDPSVVFFQHAEFYKGHS
jgi:hypothetical protein